MPNYVVKSAAADTILFAGSFPSFADCIAQSIRDGVDFSGADLRRANLLNADLDGADFSDALLSGANLTGANLSEADMRGADFGDAILHGTVLCDSDLTGATFNGTLFGGTEIFGATLRNCLFSTLSAFSLRFDEARIVNNCCYINPCGTVSTISRPPVTINGLSLPVIIMDRHIKVGHEVFDFDDIPDWIASGGMNPRNLRLRLEQIVLALMIDDKRAKIV